MSENGLSLAQIKAAVCLEAVIRSRGLRWRIAGRGLRYVAHCPFHEDQTSSFTMYVHSQRYHCFGCGTNGDVLDFVARFDGCSPEEAMERLAAHIVLRSAANCAARRKSPLALPSPLRPVPYDRKVALLTLAQQRYQEQLLHSPQALDYLAAHGLSQDVATTLGLGYVQRGVTLAKLLNTDQQALACTFGLLNPWGTDRLAGRLTIPERGPLGCHWMIGRSLPSDHHSPRRSSHDIRLALTKPLLGYERALARLPAEMDTLQAILIVKGVLEWLYPEQWRLPILAVSLVGAHASAFQLTALLDLHQRTGGLPLLLGLGADAAGHAANTHLRTRLMRHRVPVRILPSLESTQTLEDLGIRPDGHALLELVLVQALATSNQSTLTRRSTR